MFIAITPVAKPRMTQRDRWAGRSAVINYHDFCDELRLKAPKLVNQLPPQFELVFYLPMPASWSKRKRDTWNGRPHQSRPDKDNLEKAFIDALCPKVDDAYIYDTHTSKYWSDEPGIEYVTG